ncbi:alpha-1,3-mannosyl-glycoprotein 4-beta-N-acetylglucosaminyltransferase C-like [Acanthaster planci]|uniref:Alpha-1,3-mannosyl-glycoprotein 4-beta-N-acetylglucosaminyltransferase C-like n=1 Tax=Acanthaster planci TaxID=133434 RepID=A0A8B7Z7C0_ACAPL|nr:alpha-1,3-mannosyl-glycoprotein 4-beta-N-acetylglucosaminyltransferase C-like [Acanthaster planci]
MRLRSQSCFMLLLLAAALSIMGVFTTIAYILDETYTETNRNTEQRLRNTKTNRNAEERPRNTQTERLVTTTAPSKVRRSDVKHIDREGALVLGHSRKNKGFLTIGIPVSRASGESNLRLTLESLIKSTTVAERAWLTIVVFARDLDQGSRQAVRAVVANFTEPLRTGMLQLIQIPQSFAFHLGRTATQGAGDGQAIENRDNAFLIAYSSNMSNYYLQLDGRVQAVSGYAAAIRDFIKSRGSRYWVTLEFGLRPTTGNLIRLGGRDEAQLKYLLVEFGAKLPVDKVYDFFKKLNAQKYPAMRRPPLFEPLRKL